MSSARKKIPAMSTCAWCGEHKSIALMRHPTSSRGKTPNTCHACRKAHPDESWCDDHNCSHPRENFHVDRSRPIGVLNICRDASAYRIAAKRAKPNRTCPSCGREQESWYFRGGRMKRHACRDCEAANLGQRWCIDCSEWLPANTDFYRTGVDGAFWEARCKLCGIAHAHGVTREYLAELTGSATPSCAACGSTDNIKIDHDHGHCDSQRGCKECVRGYLCHQCNTAEGLLGTSKRAQLLADHMKRLGL